MSNKLRHAVDRCQEKERELQRTPEQKRFDGIVISGTALGMATAAAVGLWYTAVNADNALALAEFHQALRDTYPNALSYGLGALAALGLAVYGADRLDAKSREINGAKITPETARDIRETARSIIQVDQTINPEIDGIRHLAAKVLTRSDEQSIAIMKKNGLNPSDKKEMLRIQRAYSYGLTMASVAQAQNRDHLETLDPEQQESFINRAIVEGMVKHFESEGREKGIMASIKEVISGSDFNPHAVARASVRAVNQILSQSHQRDRNRDASLGL